MTVAKAGWLILAVIALTGCETRTLDDPNDVKTAGVLAPDVIRRQLKGTSDMLMERVGRGEITDAQFKELIAQRANELLKDLPIEKIDPARAWEYGDVFRTANRWEQAKRALEIAVANAEKTKNEDRRVNDILRLAHAEAMLGQIPPALKTARRAFDAAPEASAPILPSVLLEIVPAARGKGHDEELAQLLEDAIGKHMATVVDPKSVPGAAFLAARPHHVRNAWRTIVELYAKSGDDEKARRAIERSEKMLRSIRRL
jgi:tetratricopeptide (TPR) repeat protein